MKNGVGQVKNTGKFPCRICNKGVGANSINCTACNSWIRKKCSSIRKRLKGVSGYQCRVCVDGDSGQSEVLRGTSLCWAKD